MRSMPGKTLYDKIWDAPRRRRTGRRGDPLHRPAPHPRGDHAAGLRRPSRQPPRRCAGPTARWRSPTTTCRPRARRLGVDAVADEEARLQLQTLERNVKDYGIEFFPMGDIRNGIVHVVGPEQGRTQPGMTIVCGDSHTSTHGAFGALAHGIGTSEVEHVLATQTLRQKKAKNFRVTHRGRAGPRRRRQGLRAGRDRRDRHRRRHRLRHRIRRLGGPRRCRWKGA